MAEYGDGFATTARNPGNEVYAMSLGDNGFGGRVARGDSLQNATSPHAVPATAGLYSDLIAWQHDPGIGTPEIRVRYATDGATLGPELVFSSPALGPTDAARGLVAGGDISGEAVVAWVQGTGSSTQLVARQLYVDPGSFAAVSGFQYSRRAQPVLAWSAPRALWGPVNYVVSLDGVQLTQTTATSLSVPAALSQGPHTWRVTAVNPAGHTRATRPSTVWVDTVAPVVSFTLAGLQRAGSYIHVYASYTDAPPPLAPAQASGIAQVLVNWGDGSSYVIRHGKFHAYRRAGRYLLAVTVTDRAGNTTTLQRLVRIAPKRGPRPKKKGKGRARHTTGGAPAHH
jgi:hypothetical protein